LRNRTNGKSKRSPEPNSVSHLNAANHQGDENGERCQAEACAGCNCTDASGMQPKLRDIMENISSTLDSSAGGAFASARPVKKVLIVAINSNRGLCGGFNANIVRTVNRLLREEYAPLVKEGM